MDAEQKHTPGPWYWDDKDALPWTDYDETIHAPFLMDANGRIVMSGDDIRINNAANARLITAAPELLEALKVMLFAFEELAKVIKPLSSDPVIVSARAAVCKAEGITQNQQP